MRVAILTELFPPHIGGQELRYAEIAQALTARGHTVHVYCVGSTPGVPAEETIGGVVIHRYPQAHYYTKPFIKGIRRDPGAVLKYALRCRAIDAGAFDFFIFNQWPLAHLLVSRKAIRAKAAIDWCELRHGFLFSILQRHLPRLAAANIANSAKLKNELQARSGRSFEVVPSGIFCDRYRCEPAAEREGVLYLGRIEEHKNLPLALASYEALVATGYQGRMRIAGDGPALPKLQQAVKGSKLADRVELLGFVHDEQKIQLLARSQILLLTSKREGAPRVLAEAMASGLPIVTANFPGNGAQDVVREYAVGVVTGQTPTKVFEGMRAVMSDWERYSKCCISASRSLDWEPLIDRLLQIARNCRDIHA